MDATSVLGADVETHMADAGDGTSIAWTSQGQGDAILLAMGRAWPKEMWHRVAPVLARGHRVLTFDNRGAGETEWPGTDFTIATLAEDAVKVLDAAAVERAHVYGVSLGGLTAQEIALSHPERVRSVVLGCTAAPDRSREADLQAANPRPAQMTIEEAIRASTPFQYGVEPHPERVAEDVEVLLAARYSFEGIAAQTRAAARYVSADRLARLTLPALVLHGTADKVVPYELGVAVSRLVPGARLVTLEGAGHCYTTDATDQANSAVLDFLGSVANS